MKNSIRLLVLSVAFLLFLSAIHSDNVISKVNAQISSSVSLTMAGSIQNLAAMSLHTEGTKILNSNNQEVLWNGIDSKSLFGYWIYPEEAFLSANDVQTIRSHGLNFLRVDITLDMAVRGQPPGTPTQHNYNPNFWAKLDEIVNASAKNGMWLSIAFAPNSPYWGKSDGSSVGFPKWMYDGTWSPYFTKIYPNTADGHSAANRDFWNTNDPTAANVRLAYQTFLKDIAKRYMNYGNAFINVFNEPLETGGNPPLYPLPPTGYSKPSPTSDWGKMITCFQGFTEQTIDVIRSVDGGQKPVIVCQGYFPSHTWNPQIRRPNIVIEDHSYKADVVTSVNDYASNAFRYNQPFFLGEFGGIEDGGLDAQTIDQTILTMQHCNSINVGWAYLRFSYTPAPSASTWPAIENNLKINLIYFM